MQDIDKIAWLYIKDKCLLGARSKDKDMYYLPGGKRDHGESDEETLIREIKEELSVDIDAKTIRYAGTFKEQADGKPSGVQVRMTCYFAEFTGKLKENSEIEEIAWLTSSNKNKCSLVTGIILDWLVTENKID